MAKGNEISLFRVPRASRRGFLIMVVVGVLAVMLAICVGFLSYTRGEVNSVATIRDKNDGYDICVSAQDFMTGAIMTDVMDNTGHFDQTKYVSGAQNGQWWYRPNQKGLGNAIKQWWGEGSLRPYFHTKSESDFCYMPLDFFGEGGVRGRFQVLVMDANSVLNINDWNEDCSPTQCQMAHMIAEGYGDTILERYRAFRDNGTNNPGWNTYGTYTPLRYHEAWRAATRTTRYMDWPNWYSQGIDNEAGDYWLTTNQVWLGLYGPDYACIRATIPSDGFPMYDGTSSGRFPSTISLTTVAGSTNYQPPDFPVGSRAWRPTVPGGYGNRHYDTGGLGWGLSGFGLMGYTDPDTGRAPVNVNTCYNSGETLPMETYTPNAVRPALTMEAVFNIESLRRVVKVGTFYVDEDGNAGTAPTLFCGYNNGTGDYVITKIGANAAWGDAEKARIWQKHEMLRTKMAYRYQEALCRYFTATYKHTTSRRFPPFDTANSGKKTYNATYPAVAGVSNACGNFDYTSTRFPVSLTQFRANVNSDLTAMAASTNDYVDFDASDNPTNVPQGQLDSRTAEAVYDTIVPGEQSLGLLATRPLQELRDWKLARQEDMNDPYNVYGRWDDNPNLRAMAYQGMNHKNHFGADQDLSPKGKDIATLNSPPGPYDRIGLLDAHLPAGWDSDAPGSNVENGGPPYRQLVCPDDCLSTELTTASTTYIMIINAQLVDNQTVKLNPTDPTKHRDLFWNQWGVVVEICPDVINETTAKEYYSTARPKFYKTALPASADGMDYKCPSLKSRNLGDGTIGAPFERDNTSYVKEWQADIRGIKSGDEAGFYTGSNQTKRRVVIRSIWSLNQGIMR